MKHITYNKKKSLHDSCYKLHDRGFTLFLSVLVASLLLSIGLAISLITFKQYNLSVATRDSQKAFYAADAAAECALYWDISHPDYSQSVFGGFDPTGETFNAPLAQDAATVPLLCNNEDINTPGAGWDSDSGWEVDANVGSEDAETWFDMEFENESCASVTVIKEDTNTTIESRGYNTCEDVGGRRVERAIRVEY